jgi:tRNA uridine 5-carboxymethylaminomethyl modification enzyme
VLGKAVDHEYSLAELLRRPDVSYQSLMSLNGGQFAPTDLVWNEDDPARTDAQATPDGLFGRSVVEQVEIAARYSGYIQRQKDEVERTEVYENLVLPPELDYMLVTALSFEARQILTRQRPQTLGLASRLSGITPAAISLLLIHLKKHRAVLLGKGGKPDAPSGEGRAAASDAQAVSAKVPV